MMLDKQKNITVDSGEWREKYKKVAMSHYQANS